MDPKKSVTTTEDNKELASSSPLTLPLLDQSDDPYLNEGDESLPLVSDELDETVQKWMETCDGSSNLL